MLLIKEKIKITSTYIFVLGIFYKVLNYNKIQKKKMNTITEVKIKPIVKNFL